MIRAGRALLRQAQQARHAAPPAHQHRGGRQVLPGEPPTHPYTYTQRACLDIHIYTPPHQRFYTGLLGGGGMGAQPPSSSQKLDAGFINAVFADHDSGNNSGGHRRNLLLSDWAVGGDWAGGGGGGGAFPSLLLLEEGRLAPVERAVGGRNYTVAVSGFNLAVAGVEIRLYEGVPPTVREEATVALPKIVAAGEEGGRAVSVTFVAPEPARGKRRSRAYLRASYSGLPMPFAESLAFDLMSSSGNAGGKGR